MTIRLSSVGVGGAVVSMACWAGVAKADDPIATLRAMYPTVRTHTPGGRMAYVYGAALTPGLTESGAAAAFLSQHGRVFGTGELLDLETRQEWAAASGDGRFVAMGYTQRIRGKEVDGSALRVKVRRGPLQRVDFAAARVAGEPTMGREVPLVPASVAAAIVQVQTEYGALTVVGEPEVVVLRGNRTRPDAWCWRVRARSGAQPLARDRTFYVDTALPRIVHVRNDFWSFEPPTTGRVEALGMPASFPYLPYRGNGGALVPHPIPGLAVSGVLSNTLTGGTAQAFTNGNGEFSLSLGQPGQGLTLSTTVGQANQWYRLHVLYPPAYYLSATGSTVVGASALLQLSSANLSEEYRVAQADTVVTANRGRAFFQRYISSAAPGLAYQLNIFPNLAGMACVAGAAVGTNNFTIAFAPANVGVGCWNFGSHSAAAHEYGHIALAMLGKSFAAFPAFHEGYADTFGNMLNDDSVQGRQHWMNGRSVRDDPTSSGINCQYPISSHTTANCDCDEPHKAGQLLSGPWVRMRNGFKARYGAEAGLEYSRKLFGAWSLVTLGGDEECGSAYPGTLIEILSILPNETQGDLAIICGAFAAHGITSGGCGP